MSERLEMQAAAQEHTLAVAPVQHRQRLMLTAEAAAPKRLCQSHQK